MTWVLGDMLCKYIMDDYYKYIWVFILEELTGNIGRQLEMELYEWELNEFIKNDEVII